MAGVESSCKGDNGPGKERGLWSRGPELGFDAIGSCWRKSVMEMMLKEEDSNNYVKEKKKKTVRGKVVDRKEDVRRVQVCVR